MTTGELMAIMGPSGCGKTTLLNLLARRNPTSNVKVTGQTMVGGSDIDIASFQRISSYVEQEDTLIGSLTVEETLKFSAELSLARYVDYLYILSSSNNLCNCV
jgi:ABC-type multidrug transport system ATPase subunit